MYSNRQEKLLELLDYIAKNGEAYQSELDSAIGRSYRQILRQLDLLECLYLAKIKRTTRIRKRGKPNNIWELTFSGLLVLFGSKPITPEDFETIAKRNREKWLIFQEWKYLSEDEYQRKLILENLTNYARRHHTNLYGLTEKTTKVPSVTAWKEPYKKFIELMEESFKKEAIIFALSLNNLFAFRPLTFNEPSNYYDYFMHGFSYWKKWIANPTLRKFIEEQFKIEERTHKRVTEFQKWLFSN